MKRLVTKDMVMGDIIERFPVAAEVMSSYGLQCIGCHANPNESLEAGALGHGMSKEEMENMLEELNELAAKGKEEPKKAGIGKDMAIKLTQKAAEKLKYLMSQQGKNGYGLRVKVVPGGCAGYSYAMDIDKKPLKEDKVFNFFDVKVFVDEKSLQRLAGTEIDYVETLQESGFKFNNPNATSSCKCGESFR